MVWDECTWSAQPRFISDYAVYRTWVLVRVWLAEFLLATWVSNWSEALFINQLILAAGPLFSGIIGYIQGLS